MFLITCKIRVYIKENNEHCEAIDSGKHVWFSHSQIRSSKIERLIVFNWKGGEWFAAELFFDKYLSKNTPFVPSQVTVENTPKKWADIPEKCWVHLIGYKELDRDDLHQIISSRTKTPLDEKMQERGFRASEFDL